MDGYRKLKAWHHCRELAISVYAATKTFPASEQYGLVAQLRRAAVSPCVNIAEGWARRGTREFRRFLGMALASLAELDTLLDLSRQFGYLRDAEYVELRSMYVEASKTTFGLLKAVRRK